MVGAGAMSGYAHLGPSGDQQIFFEKFRRALPNYNSMLKAAGLHLVEA